MKKIISTSFVLLLLSCAGLGKPEKPNPIYTGDFKCGNYDVNLSYKTATKETKEYQVQVSNNGKEVRMKSRTLGYGYKNHETKQGYISTRVYFSADSKSSFANSVTFVGKNPSGDVEKIEATLRMNGKTMKCEFLDPIKDENIK